MLYVVLCVKKHPFGTTPDFVIMFTGTRSDKCISETSSYRWRRFQVNRGLQFIVLALGYKYFAPLDSFTGIWVLIVEVMFKINWANGVVQMVW
jgi:hypothetical protein